MSEGSFDPKSIVNTEEYGDPFEEVQSGLDFLLQSAKAKGYQAQVNVNFLNSGVSRFAVNQMTQHTDLSKLIFKLKLIHGKKQASSASTKIGSEGYSVLFDQVESNMMKSPEIPFLEGLPTPRSGSNADLSGEKWSMEDRADTIVQSVNAASEVSDEFRLSGTASATTSYQRVVSTAGLDVETSFDYNFFKVNAIVGPADGRGYGQEQGYWRFDKPDVEEWSKEAVKTAVDTTETKLITKQAGDYQVVLAPEAVSNLMVYVLFGADATSFHESNSYTSDRLGDQIFDTSLTIMDMPRDPRESIFSRTHDAEGIPTENQAFFDSGVLKFIPYSSFMASKYLDDKEMATGHANGIELDWMGDSSMPVSASVTPGSKAIEDQIAEVDEGLYVKSFWYNRFTKQREGGLTGLTRNGLFYIKDGEVQGAVRNLRYTDSFVSAFGEGNIVSMSREKRKTAWSHVPSMHLSKFHFSSVAHTNQQLE